MRNSLRFLLPVLFLAAAFSSFAQAPTETGFLPALSDGSGSVKLIWTPPKEAWPAGGFTLERAVMPGPFAPVAKGLRPDWDPALTASLPGPQRDPIKRLGALDRQAGTGKASEDFSGLKNFLFFAAYGDLAMARAMGLAWEDHPGTGGPYLYRVVDGAGKIYAASLPVDPARATPPGPPPPELKADPTPEGVRLDWGKVKPGKDVPIPVLAFRVKRDDGKGFMALGKGPLLGAGDKQRQEKNLPRYLDAEAPQGREVRYTVVGIDIFGRETQAAPPLAVSIPDFAASYPPAGLKVEPSGGKVMLTWKPSDRSNTAGYIMERAAYLEGPWEVLTPKLLPRSTARFEDGETKAGQRLYYRITARDTSGRTGSPSVPVMVVARAGAAPTAPLNLRATLGVQRVQLAWDAVPNAVAYQVERTDPGSDRWTPVASHTTPEPRYEDALVTGQKGVLRYRVIAVAGDNTMGAPSAILEVPLPRNWPPSAPRITGFDGTGGRVTLTFVPTGDPADTAGFYVLRGPSLAATPEVLQVQPLAASAREYTDEHVLAGEQFVYRLVAVDSALNRSEASAPVTVRVGEASLPVPPAPRARYVAGPLPKVVVTFEPAPEGNLAMVQRRAPGETAWLQVAGPMPPGAGEASDLRPPSSGKASYRVFYKTPMGTPGPPSPEVELLIPSK
jgi:hypothetical protein